MSKILLSFLLVISLSLSGCKSETGKKDNIKIQKEFDKFLDEQVSEYMAEDSLNIEYIFVDPKAYGYGNELLELPYNDYEDYDEATQSIKETIDELCEFDKDALTSSQQEIYDIYLNTLRRNLDNIEFYYLDNSYLGSMIGFQAQLPMLLNEYTFESQWDLDSYFNILETSVETFEKYANNEIERQKNNVGMSQEILNKVIKQCDTFSSDKDCFLIESINQKIDEVDFLDENQKIEAKAKNKQLITEKLLTAYKRCSDILKTIDAPDETLGLSHLPNGKEYYEYLLQYEVGVDMKPNEIKKYFEKRMKSLTTDMSYLIKNSGVDVNSITDASYGDFNSASDNLDYLKEAISKDFPSVSNLSYEINYVDESLKDHFSPAAYLVGKVDAPNNYPEEIYINGEYSSNLFTTIAHEGYPGHMYQHSYFKQKNPHVLRLLMDCSGYNEGWATYIENNIWEYADVSQDEKNKLEILSINSQLVQCIIGIADVGIHYEGWNFDEFKDFLSLYFGDLDEEVFKEQYELIVETPTNYLKYYLYGALLDDLNSEAKSSLGDQYLAVEFHEAVLDSGAVPYSMVKDNVKDYMKNKKNA